MIQNFLDVIVLGALILFLLAGIYRGFLSSLFSLTALIICTALALIFSPLVSKAALSQEKFIDTVLYYTEGEEYVNDVEIARSSIYSVDTDSLTEAVTNPEMPYPMGERISENIAAEAFAEEGITTVGEYFNQTIVRVSINILSFLLLFVILRCISSFVIHNIDYAHNGYPRLHSADWLIGAGIGLIRGFLGMFIVFSVIPLILIALPVDMVKELIEGSFFVRFYYESNLILSIIPAL